MTTTYSSTNSNTKSLNAHLAEEAGRYPASHWPAILRRKGLFPGVTAADIKAAVWTDEWHHTGTFAARTNYYSLQDIYDYRRELRQEILRRNLQKAWFPVVMHEAARVSFTEWQGSGRRATRYTYTSENARVVQVSPTMIEITGEFKERRGNNISTTTVTLTGRRKKLGSRNLQIEAI